MQQQMLYAQTQIPDDVARLAHEQDLGAPQPGYTVTQLKRGWRWLRFAPLVGIFCLALGFISFSFFISNSIPNPFLFFIPMILGYIIFLSSMIVLRIVFKRGVLYPCERGFILKQQQNKFRVLRWDEIEALCSTSTRPAGQLFLRGLLYMIYCHDGYVLTLRGVQSKRNPKATLEDIFHTYFTRRRLPFQFADYQAGQTLSFGPLRVNREGISALDKTLSWEQVASVEIQKGRRLVIYKTGEPAQTWLNLPTLKIANLSIFLALYKRIRSGQSEQEMNLEALSATYGPAATLVQARGKIDAIPDGLAMLAEEHQLGERRLDQPLGRSRFASWAKIGALAASSVCLLGGVLWGGMTLIDLLTGSYFGSNPVFFIEIAIYGLFLLVFTIRNLLRNLQQIHNYTYTFERGLLLKRGSEAPVVVRWEDIAIIWRDSGALWLSQRRNRVSIQLMYAHIIQLHNGKKYTLTRLNINQEALGKIIKEQIVPLQMPAIIEAFQAGQSITFGTVQAQIQGITVGKRFLPWSQVKSVTLQGNNLVIYNIAQRKPWHRVQATSIPNLFLLFALADYVRNTGAL